MFELLALGSLVEKQQGGGTPPRNDPAFWHGDIPWASVKDFKDDQLELKATEETITSLGLRSSTSSLIPPGTPMVCTRMAVGRCAASQTPTAINQDVRALYPKKGVNHRYLLRLVASLQRKAESLSVGSTVKGIRSSDFLAINTHIAPENEQGAIAHILDTLDTQIQKTEALIAKLEKVKEGLLHDLLTRGIDVNGRLRPSPEQAPELYKESPLGLIPREWEVVGFLDAVELPSGQISPLIEPYASLPLIAPDHIEAGVSRLIRVETARDQGAISGKYIVRPGDVVYSKIRPYLRKAWLADIDSICSADMYPLRPKLLTSAILLRIVMSESFSTYANAASMRTGIPKINRDELSGYTFALPTIQEQVRMENIFQGIERKADKEREALSKLVFEKIGLMDDLLTGRVRVTPLLDQAQATTPA
ncbi:restriction endonuclease subunit S [Billgrantia ethanolica]|uniref:Type I restriction modification DNA specificity domain-containing protein n=1 Tax=Billgrantia ethanolica TaxID=2733486 RepID=A0ABS9A7A0_9GAMM|nr:restriction endonuclease subunit S [Halomonas ethanolica]MCE8004417.1 hypothetical protein [Halomonas ethanolica]